MTLNLGKRVGAPARLLMLFVLFSAIPLASLGWLGWRMLGQERELESQRLRERLDNAAAVLARELDRGLLAWEDMLLSLIQHEDGSRESPESRSTKLPQDAVLLAFDSQGVQARKGAAVAYYPLVPAWGGTGANAALAAAETLELRERKLDEAATQYRRIAGSAAGELRAAALMRLARTFRVQQQLTDALSVYGELAAMTNALLSTGPAEFVARRERIALFRAMGKEAAATEESRLLAAALAEGRYVIDRATFEFYSEAAPVSHAMAAQTLELANGAEGLWPVWNEEPSGRRAWNGGNTRRFTVWRKLPDKGVTVAALGSLASLETSIAGIAEDFRVEMKLEDQDADSRRAASSGGGVLKMSRETGLPWTLRITSLDHPSTLQKADASRRNLLAAGFALLVLVIAAAGYVVFRAVNRELSVARLQSDFVAAVSHEFRTPLTAMCHLTEMLEEGEVPAERRSRYYQALGRESRRLRDMVENLLDFGRMEAGRRAYQMEDEDAAEIVASVVEDFREHVSPTATRLEWSRPAPGAVESSDSPGVPNAADAGVRVRVDREALKLALRNLIDNALKYSPASTTVNVSVERRNGRAGISVEDHGAGIAKDEQRMIFRKFVRGSAAKSLNVKGTGIGLAMAHQIVRAHGGQLDLTSYPGHGSRFTIWLPAQPEQCEG